MKRKLFLMMLVLATVLSNVTVLAAENYFSGEGTEDNPYLISTAEDLTKLSSLTNAASTNATYGAAHYKLTDDIDMIGATFAGLNCMDTAWNYKYFTGVFDGDGHVISNITINSTSNRARGFISVASGAKVRNLGIENISIKGGAMGGIIAQDTGAKSTVENCYVRNLSATKNVNYETVAGIVGYAQSTDGSKTTITNCYAVGLSSNSVRAIIGYDTANGYQSHGNLTNCYSDLSDKIEGLGGTQVTNCFASTTASGVTAATLGKAFKENPTVKNDGYPLLSWESTEGYDMKEDEEEAEDPYFVGKGTEEEPFEIGTASDLTKLAELTNDSATAGNYANKVYKLTDNIDMTGISYKPVSWATSMYTVQGATFTGTLDGNNHVIKNISFTNLATYGSTYGIIGYLGANGVVKNLGVENMTVNGGTANRLCIGGIVGTLGNAVIVENSYVRGMSVTTTSTDATYVGGIAGRTVGNEGKIKNCYATDLDFSKVTRADLKAGILGSSGNTGYKAENCYTTNAKVQGNTSVTNSYMGTTNCYSGDAVELLTAKDLGETFDEDSDLLNEGMPVLVWEYDIAHPETVYYTIKSGDKKITDGEKDISVKTPIVITFDREMNTDTFSKIQILKKGVVFSDYIFEAESRTLTIKMNMDYNTEYTIFIPKTVQSVKDENGKSAKADEKTIAFRTEAIPKAITVEGIKINGEKNPPEKIVAGEKLNVEVDVKNTGELKSQPVALIVTLFGQDGIMKYAALDTANIKDTSETLTVELVVPENAGEKPVLSVMVWDSVTTMNAMK